MTELPASFIAPVRVAADTPVGFLVAHKPAGTKMLVLSWEEQRYAMFLTEDNAFRYFQIKPGVTLRGALIKDVEFRVDIESAYYAVQKSDPLGALVIKDGQLFVIAVLIGDGWAEPVEVPLWGEYPNISGEEKVGFTRWSVVARDGEGRTKLFSYEATLAE